MWRAWSQRWLRAETVDRLLAAVLLAWALFDVPWWWRPPGHGGSAPVILGVIALAAAQSVPFLWRRQQPAAVLALPGAPTAVNDAATAAAGIAAQLLAHVPEELRHAR